MGITIFKIFICEGISSNICSEITLYSCISKNISPEMKILNKVIPSILLENCICMLKLWQNREDVAVAALHFKVVTVVVRS